jgi:hypothetical protein
LFFFGPQGLTHTHTTHRRPHSCGHMLATERRRRGQSVLVGLCLCVVGEDPVTCGALVARHGWDCFFGRCSHHYPTCSARQGNSNGTDSVCLSVFCAVHRLLFSPTANCNVNDLCALPTPPSPLCFRRCGPRHSFFAALLLGQTISAAATHRAPPRPPSDRPTAGVVGVNSGGPSPTPASDLRVGTCLLLQCTFRSTCIQLMLFSGCSLVNSTTFFNNLLPS